jgi:putative protease
LANTEQYSDALRDCLVFLPLSTPPAFIRSLAQSGQRVGIDVPRGMFGTEKAVQEALCAAADAGACAALCGNIGAIPLAKEAKLTAIGGFGLNITNRQALAFYHERGLAAATLSMELTFPQMQALCDTVLPTGIMVYGRQPLMLTRNCPRKAALGSCAACNHQGIKDRTGTQFPVMCAGGCSEVLNSVPLYWGDRTNEIPHTAFHLFHFTTETKQEVSAVLHAYHKGTPPPPAITRGLYRRGVE